MAYKKENKHWSQHSDGLPKPTGPIGRPMPTMFIPRLIYGTGLSVGID